MRLGEIKVGLLLRTVNAFRIATLFTMHNKKFEFTDFAHTHTHTHTHTVLTLTLTLPAHVTAVIYVNKV